MNSIWILLLVSMTLDGTLYFKQEMTSEQNCLIAKEKIDKQTGGMKHRAICIKS